MSLSLLFQQLIDPLQVIETIVDKETEFRNNAQLIAHPCAQLVTNGFLIAIDVLQHLVAALRRKYTEVSRADTEIWRDTTSHHAWHGSATERLS